jgi:hypothetical protein
MASSMRSAGEVWRLSGMVQSNESTKLLGMKIMINYNLRTSNLLRKIEGN